MRRAAEKHGFSAFSKATCTLAVFALVACLCPLDTAVVSGALAAPAKEKSKAKRSSKSKQKTDENAAEQLEALTKGIAAVTAGQAQDGVKLLTTAIDSGKLKIKETARALYFRGKAYRMLDQPALAIADLTSALWKPGALDGDERKSAIAEREAAYRGGGHERQSVAAAAEPLPTTPPAPAPQPEKPVAVSNPPPPPAIQQTKPTKWTTQVSPTQQPAPSTGGSFLTALFGGSSASSPPAQTPVASTSQPATGTTSSWSTTPRTSTSAPRATTTQVAAHASDQATGSLQVRVAAVRSMSDAEAVVRKLAQRHGNLLGSRKPSIDKGVVGNMGTMYQVKIGPYRTAQETQQLCGKLIADGLDCLVLSAN